MLATSKRLRSSSPPSSPLDQVTKRRRHTSSQQGSSSQQGPVSLHEESEADTGGWQQPRWVAAGPSGWRGDVPPAPAAHQTKPAGSPWDLPADSTFYSPTGRPPPPSSYFLPHGLQSQAAPSPLGLSVQSPSYFPPFPPASAALLQQATAGRGPSIHTPRGAAGAQHNSHAHHRNAPLFHPAFVDQHPPWSSSSSASSVAASGAHGRPPDGMGPLGAFGGGRSQQEATTPLMGPPTLPVPSNGRDNSRRVSFGRPTRRGMMEDDEPDDEDDEGNDTWDATAGTIQDNLDALADSPYAGMNQLLHSLVRQDCPLGLLSRASPANPRLWRSILCSTVRASLGQTWPPRPSRSLPATHRRSPPGRPMRHNRRLTPHTKKAQASLNTTSMRAARRGIGTARSIDNSGSSS